MFAEYLFLRFNDCREILQINPSQTLMNLQYSKHNTCKYIKRRKIYFYNLLNMITSIIEYWRIIKTLSHLASICYVTVGP